VAAATLRWTRRPRGKELVINRVDFRFTRDWQSIAGFLLNRVPQEVAHTNEWQNMNAKDKRVRARFGSETRFELKPVCAAVPGATQETHLDKLRNRLLLERLDELLGPHLNSQLRLAANEAAALACLTPYPLLVFPTLFEEKAKAALLYAERQEQVRQRSRKLLGL